MLRFTLCLVVVFGCAACNDACDPPINIATNQAVLDAEGCAFAPEALEKPDCSRNDARPLLNYYATYCANAEVSCIQQDTDASGVCFGNP